MVNIKEETDDNEDLFLQLRNKFIHELDVSADLYDPVDIERIKTDDEYCKRFILHKKGNFSNAYEMLKEALAWRKSFGARFCTEESIPSEFFEARAAFPYNEDKHGNPVILLLIRFHKKDSEYAKDMRRFVIYWVEKMEEQSHGGQMTVVMNCNGAGLSNLDLDLIKFLITLFRSYYPHSLAHILIFEMPWIFNAAWKIIKSWLPEDFVEKIVFVNRETILNFIDAENMQVDMGGSCTMQYEPPKRQNDVNSNSITENSLESSRRVHFSHNGHTSQESLAGSPPTRPRSSSRDKSHLLITDDYCILAGILKISPANNLIFYSPVNKDDVSEVTIKLSNVTEKSVTYKVKTNNIENYRVKPSIGVIEPNGSIDVSVYITKGQHPQPSDKFLIMAMEIPEAEVSMQNLSTLWRSRTTDQMADHKLKCIVGIPDSEKPEKKLEDTLKSLTFSLENLNNKVQHLQLSQQAIARNQRWTLCSVISLGVMICFQFVFANYYDLMDAMDHFIFN